MGTLSALLLATPLFGLSLTPPSTSFLLSPYLVPEVAQAEEGGAPPSGEGETETQPAAETETPTLSAEEEGQPSQGEQESPPTQVVEPSLTGPVAETPPPPPPPPTTLPPPSSNLTTIEPNLSEEQTEEARVAEAATGSSFESLRQQGESRRQRRNAHMGLGIATWLAMATTMTIGAIQFNDRYGASEYQDTRCARGTAVLGQANCEHPYIHLFSALTTGALYFSTFGLSVSLSHDENSDLEQQRRTDRRLRMHRTLRWVHFGLMVAQIIEGLIFANLDNGALDRQEDHGTLRGLNAFHMAVGVATLGTLTWAGALMIGR